MPNTYLKVPSIDELHYRQEWMKDPKTMSYNAGYDMDFKGYDKETGTITKTDEEMMAWYNNWVNKEPDKYFAYIYDSEIAEPIGEVYYYFDNGIHSMGIVIQDKYRGKGHSYNALLELEEVAFEKNNISELSDIIPLDRIGAIKTFKKAGFIQTKEKGQLLITKDMYMNNVYLNQNIDNPTYLFHGSPKLLDKLEPRQSHDSDNNKNNIANAIFMFPSFLKATPYAFKDTIKECSKNLKYDFEIPNGNEYPLMTMKNVIVDDDIAGYIYVFKKDNDMIKDNESYQYKCYKEKEYIDTVKVYYKDYKKYYKKY